MTTRPHEESRETGRDDAPPVRFWSVDEVEAMDFDPFMEELLQQDSPALVKLPHGTEPAWVAARYDDVKLVTSDPRFSREALVGRDVTRLAPHFIPLDDAVGFADPPEHTRMRKTVAAMFTHRRIEKLRPRAEEIAGRLLDTMERAGPPADVMEHLNTPFALGGMSELMGVPEEDWPKMAKWARLVISAEAGREASEQAKHDIGAYFADLAAQRLAEPRDDVLSHMAAAERDGRLTHQELVAFAVLMQISGTNSVRFNSSNMVYLLLTHPDHLARLRAERELLPQAVDELLRFVPHRNAVGMARVAVEDVRLGDVTVRRGDPIYVSYLAANRDPEKFSCPHRMDFDRTFNPHVSFGSGPHYCVGASLAKMECEVMLGGLLDRFPRLRLAVAPEEIEWRRGELIRGPHALPVTW
ncbi:MULTISPECIES: cytochrome P450 [Streptomycetaceae]|uniref:Cytochrome P450 n=1 Tax=Streptantibioticus cattleyicolor (strain ATCC 35852 / DSM 46488 / JCM 4925 / NBRC 14057 / NRRL 8057) TaxID=1003195 RepID=F8K0I8_STREN|nr:MULTISPECIES: cytochrome P450 [Streptomycetaceae]AEW97391.1 cytochrome P450 [Streptantibioticus cattleyicolor NRRL 8057 = DSM 46488]MYS61838.1 cytochrome P450 [Streptomyces sp. SID5468]CCB77716.1 putative cytochrome P450 [Streptantibioticus cattleyicolor NRRL 8057 = DSM 46488]